MMTLSIVFVFVGGDTPIAVLADGSSSWGYEGKNRRIVDVFVKEQCSTSYPGTLAPHSLIDRLLRGGGTIDTKYNVDENDNNDDGNVAQRCLYRIGSIAPL
jgi:hypothetical protein